MLPSVLNICETAKGGPATYFRLLHETTARFVRHQFIVPDSHKGELPESLSVRTFPDPGRGIRKLSRLLAVSQRLAHTENPNVLFFHSTFALPVMVALRFLRVPGRFLYCSHGWAALRYPKGSAKYRVVSKLEGWMSGASDMVVNISHADYEHALCHGYHGTHCLIENAVPDSVAFSKRVSLGGGVGAVNLLFIGRFDYQKGVDILVSAFNNARQVRADLRLHLVGAPVLDDEWKPGINDVASDVIMHGWRSPSEVQSYCEAADIVVVPSRWEGFGLVVAEAFRAGTPVLVSDRGALPGLVEPGVTGYIVPLSVPEMSQALLGLQKQILSQMRPACRKSYESRFHSARFTREMGRLLVELSAL